MRTLFLALFFASICCVVVPIQGQTERKDSAGNKNSPGNTTNPHPAQSPSPAVAIGSPVKQEISQDQGNRATSETPSYFSRLVTPETLPNTVLCLIGIAGIVTAWFTLQKMETQIDEMQKATVVMERSAKATEDSMALGSDTAERQLRAYVCVSAGLLKYTKEGIAQAQVDYENFGQTPAYDVQCWIGTWLEKWPLNASLPEPPADFDKSLATMPPGGKAYNLVSIKRTIPEEFRPFLGTARATFYVFGAIRYKDAFGKERVTKYRLMYGGTASEQQWIESRSDDFVTARLKPDREGNEAT